MLMRTKYRQRRVVLAIALALLGIFVPYLIAWRISPDGTVFNGFLTNPLDGFTYLAKMRQGFDGNWLFQLPYTADPGEGSLLFLFYLALGHLSRLIHVPLILTYHAARVGFSLVFFIVLWLFFERVFKDRRLRFYAFLLSLFGSGLGWAALLVLGRETIDFWVPEAFPLLSAYANPHFPLALSAFIGAILLTYLRGRRAWWHWPLAFLCGSTIGLVLPFITIPLFLVLGIWVLWELLQKRGWTEAGWFGRGPLTLVVLFIGAFPWLAYDYWLSITHPIISAWNAQNLTPSPALLDTILGFGLVFAFALISLFWRPWKSGRGCRLLVTWFVLGFVLLYAPLPFQRRMSVALYVPMAGLTVWWLGELAQSEQQFRRRFIPIFLFSLPTILLVMIAGLSGVATGEDMVLFTKAEREAYAWIKTNIPPGALILADPLHGNRLPAFAPVRVLYGHPFETPDAEFWEGEVESLLSWDGPPDEGLQRLKKLGVEYVLIESGDAESSIPSWYYNLDRLASFDDLEILRDKEQ
jgi:hypothetical protein